MRILLAGVLIANVVVAGAGTQAPAASEFVGSTPCGDAVRAFLGGIERGAACHAVRWKLVLEAAKNGAAAWTVTATYGVPPPGNANLMVDGPTVSVKGMYQTAAAARGSIKATYRLTTDGSKRSISFAQVGGDLLHLVTENDALMVGNGGWSYTLNRANRIEPPGTPAPAPDMSYTISPRATGNDVFGLFEGRTPCAGITRELRITPISGCLKLKWLVTLFGNAATSQPSTYKIESTLHRSQARTGTWQMLRGAPTDANATVYQLNATETEGPMLLLKGSEDVLFVLDQQRRLLVGNIDFGYTLNRVSR